jgi:hypothetical protein
MTDLGLAPGLVVLVAFSLLGYLVISLTWQHQKTIPFQLRLFFVAFLLRFAMSLAIYQFGLVKIIKDEDASGWEVGAAYYRLWAGQGLTVLDIPGELVKMYEFGVHHRGYYLLLGALFYTIQLTGPAGRLPAAVLNNFVGALTVIFAYRVARSLFSERVAVRVGWLSCFFPSLIVWSAQTLKEPVVIFLETLAVYGCTQLNRIGFVPRYIFLTLLAIVLLIPLRFYAAYVTIATVVASAVLGQLRVGGKVGSLAGLFFVLVPIFLLSGVLLQKEAQLQRYDLDFLKKFRGYNAGAEYGSRAYYDFDLNSPTGFSAGAVVGMVHLLFAPFPWQLVRGSLRMLFVMPELFLWWWIFFWGVIPGMRATLGRRFFDLFPLVFFLVALTLLYSLSFSNVGLAYRQRAQLLPWFFVFAAVGFERRAARPAPPPPRVKPQPAPALAARS